MDSVKKPLSVVLVSGGLDSAVTASIAAREGSVAFLHANYGQRTEARELQAFNRLVGFFDVSRTLVVEFEYLRDIGGSALTDERMDVPPGDLSREGVPLTYVPFRNAHLLSAGISWAETMGACALYIGAVEEDSSGYPDCREEFFKAFERAAALGTRPQTEVRIVTPVIKMKKSEIVLKGAELGTPFDLTWSCYSDSDRACGACDSCLLRLRGFSEANVKDPIAYRTPASV